MKYLLFIISICLSLSCDREGVNVKPLLSEAIVGTWDKTQQRGWPTGPEWFVYDSVTQQWTFDNDGNFQSLNFTAPTSNEQGTYIVDDISSILTLQTVRISDGLPGTLSLPVKEFDQSMFVIEGETDEGLLLMKFERVN